MLKTLLHTFRSFAVVATHSSYIACEVPAACVRVFREAEAGRPHISPPPMDTCGADLGMIANCVFDDLLESKPFEQWLLELAQSAGGFENFARRFSTSLPPEAMMFVRNAIADSEVIKPRRSNNGQANSRREGRRNNHHELLTSLDPVSINDPMLEASLDDAFKIYESAGPTLSTLRLSPPIIVAYNAAMISLYGKRRGASAALYKGIRGLETRACSYCGKPGDPGTLDHLLNKVEFPEFSLFSK